MNTGLLLGFWMTALLLIAVPGPDWAFVLASGERHRRVLPAVGGLMFGYSILAGAVAAGAGALVANSPAILTGLTVIGAAYLLYLGGSLVFGTGDGVQDTAHATGTERRLTGWAQTTKGVGVSCLNPKGLLLFLALLPQFTDRDGSWPISVQIGTLGAVFVVTCGAFYSAMGLGAKAVLRSRPTMSAVISKVSGAAMVIVAALLVAEHVAAA